MVNGVVTGVQSWGCFVNCSVAKDGMLHASEADPRGRYVADMTELFCVGDRIQALRVLSVDGQAGKFTLSQRVHEPEPPRPAAAREHKAPAHRAPEFPPLVAAPEGKEPLAVEPSVESRSARVGGDAILHADEEPMLDLDAKASPLPSAAAVVLGTQSVPALQPAPAMEVLLTKMIRGKVHTLYKMP